jgi:hypothetical protein
MPLLFSFLQGRNVAVASVIMTAGVGSIVVIRMGGIFILREALLQAILVWRGNRLPRTRVPRGNRSCLA